MNKWLSRYRSDQNASVTVEFVVTLPVLLAALAFITQYGEALEVRNQLDSKVRDAARYLAQAPLDDQGSISNVFITNAQGLIEDTIEDVTESITYNEMTVTDDWVTVDVEVEVSFPLLRFIDLTTGNGEFTTFTMSVSEVWPRT